MLARLSIMMLALAAATRLAAGDPLVLVVLDAAEVANQTVAGEAQLVMRLNSTSREAFARFSADHVGRVVEMRVDGKLVASPRIAEPIEGGSLILSGFKPGEAKGIARRMREDDVRVEVEPRAD